MIRYHLQKMGFGITSSIFIFILALWVVFSCSADAFIIDEKLPSTALESRAIKIFKITRCLVCSGESLHESQSIFAIEMRAMIRRNILNGMTDEEILDDLKKRYGSHILDTMPHNKHSYFLWISPIFFAFSIAAAILLKAALVKRNAAKCRK